MAVVAPMNDLTIYERHAHEWWDPSSPTFRSLHSVNKFRVELLHEWLGADLEGRVVIDLGCGGGLLAEPLARAGAHVIGIDLSDGSLRVADQHVEAHFLRADLRRAPLRSGSAAIVVLADVLEHMSPIGDALDEAARLLAPGGLLYVCTINKTARAKRLAVDVAEGLRLVPRGTHDHELFVPPDELCREALARGLRLERIQGESVRVLRTALARAIVLARSDDLSVGYSALLRKVGVARTAPDPPPKP